MRSGVSTPVFRVRAADKVFYVRLAETPAASLAPEARVHALLRERGVRVPDVVFFDPFDEALGRSVLITTEIPGKPVAAGDLETTTRRIVHEAGRELAIINQLPVRGYGWILRERDEAELRAEYAAPDRWAATYVAAVEQLERARRLTSRAALAARAALESWAAGLSGEPSRLAHGDFDVSHIFQCGGRYSGVIDFGEIRGTSCWYDLGYFSLHDGETLTGLVFPDLLAGYHEVQPVLADQLARIELEALAIGLMAFARTLGKPETAATVWMERRVRHLLDRWGSGSF
ncbi:MAG TPA: aminoglycoside phosphotransferase family protein [Nitrolancea sp.]|nr:aminoglycoside phosphotransferase family protein [Nitrolancea sp.]